MQVWINLISNAVKYSKYKTKTFIEISGNEVDGKVIYQIKDNGDGFDMEYSNKLFGVFQRLHSKNKFEGTGIGLALVKKIIQKHHGRVWAESIPNQGASFYFSLPQ
jgi:light-regulated signal transduction histidine kinase (bacteriophytochrome)